MDCSVLWATSYPTLWMKIDDQGKPIPLSTGPPVINDNSTRSVVVNEFEKATLECTATGSPPPRIEWRRADNAILPTGGVVYRGTRFQIHSVKREDRGTYFCVADNGVGKAKKRHVALEVEFA